MALLGAFRPGQGWICGPLCSSWTHAKRGGWVRRVLTAAWNTYARPTTIGLTFILSFSNYGVGNPLWAVWDIEPIATPVQIPGLPTGCVANIGAVLGAALVSVTPQPSSPPNYFLAIPSNTSLIGLRIVYQGLQLNLGTLRACTSSAVDMRVGR